jgi:hypothetical protein
MSCECSRCRQHYRTLGFTYATPSESEIQDAYKEGVKQWHPDLFQDFAFLRADAEEHFKEIQVAYRELKEHNSVGAAAEMPVAAPVRGETAKSSEWSMEPPPTERPTISFDGAPGCLAASDFTEEVKQMVAGHLGSRDTAVAIIDLGRAGSRNAFAQFFLLGARGMMFRDGRGIISLLWYKDMGDVHLAESRSAGKGGLWGGFGAKLAGHSGSQLQIYRSNGTLFFTIAEPVEDSAKRVIYEFLQRQREQAQQ